MKKSASIGIAVAAVVVAGAVWHLSAGRSEDPPAQAAPAAAVAEIGRRDLYKEVTIQAEFRPYEEVELYAKVAGYLRTINVDFGDRVKTGDLIATLEVPELRDELDSAVAAEERARAQSEDASLDYQRLVGVAKSQPNLVAQQDIDAAQAKYLMAAAAVAAAKADVEKYRTLDSYTRITAPFDGVITARYADPGALIQTADSSQTQSLPLVRISENQRLRLDFPVSVSYASDIAVGEPVEIRLEGSDRVIHAPVSRFTQKITTSTRTMDTEVEVPNPDYSLIPGMYATAVLHLDRRPGALAVPVEAVSGGAQPVVDRVGAGDRIEERPVKLGIESPDYYEVLSGLDEGDLVVVGGRSGLQPGEKVQPQTVAEASEIP